MTKPIPGTAPPVVYKDRKRPAWLLSLLVPASVTVGPILMLVFGHPWVLWLPVATFYLVVPVFDLLLGEDLSNPPEEAVPGLDADPYYRWITYLLVPILWAAFVFGAWFVARHDLPWHGLLAMVLITGSTGGFCINLAHELGHKNTALEHWLARISLAPTGYGHFTVEHNRGHHRDVATPADPASSRMGESIYRFVLREMPGAFVRAWALEKARLQRHSDHHAHPLRRYQSLRHFDQLPRLPSGYFGMFLVAYCPPLWRRLMDERLLATVGRDAARINMDPRHRAKLVHRFQLHDTAA